MINSIIEEYVKNNPGQKVTKKEIHGILKAFETALINKMTSQIQENGKEEKKIKVLAVGNLGSFVLSYRAARKLNLPSKSGSKVAPETWVAGFKPSKYIKQQLKIATENKSKTKK